jgi:hypothetical protein
MEELNFQFKRLDAVFFLANLVIQLTYDAFSGR